jgi:transcriptional repressor NrdR
MLCSNCGSTKSKVLDGRANLSSTYYRRRRECLNCKHKFSTLEHREIDVLKHTKAKELVDKIKELLSHD